MGDELAAAVVAVMVAALNLLVVELRIRAERRQRAHLERRVRDVQAKVGADRRQVDVSDS